MEDDRTEKEYDRVVSFLNILLGLDIAALTALLIPVYVAGSQLPASLPFKLGEGHYEFYFYWQVVAFGFCAGANLFLQLAGLWINGCACFRRASKIMAFIILVVTFAAVGSSGCQILHNPNLLKPGSQGGSP